MQEQQPTRKQFRRELLFIAIASAAVVIFFALRLQPHGDDAAHFHRVALVLQGNLFWDNSWYGGNYPIFSYSLLYYWPAALFGNLAVAVVATITTSVLFSALTISVWGWSARWAGRLVSVFAVEAMLRTEYAYGLGIAFLLATLLALQKRRFGLVALFTVLTMAASPLAFAFLCAAAGGLFVAINLRNRSFKLSRSTIIFGASLLVTGVVMLSLTRVFPTPWVGYPYPTGTILKILVLSFIGIAITLLGKNTKWVAWIFFAWAGMSLLGYILPTPIGANFERPISLLVPLMLIPAVRIRSIPVAVLAIWAVATLAFSATHVRDGFADAIRGQHRDISAPWNELVAYLKPRNDPHYRVEVVATAAHWEAYYLPKAGINIARGWYRQIDLVMNSALYDSHLDREKYAEWLRKMSVRYVVLTRRGLGFDGRGAKPEVDLLLSGKSGLKLVKTTPDWFIYEFKDPVPIVGSSKSVKISSVGIGHVKGSVGHPGKFKLAITYMPYWKASPSGTKVTKAPDGMTEVEVARKGNFELKAG